MSSPARRRPLATLHSIALRGLISVSVAVVERRLRKALATRSAP